MMDFFFLFMALAAVLYMVGHKQGFDLARRVPPWQDWWHS